VNQYSIIIIIIKPRLTSQIH